MGTGGQRKIAIMVDVDGTLALKGDRNPHKYDTCLDDLPNTPVLRLLEMIGDQIIVILVSGRPEEARVDTVRWMNRHGVSYAILFMRRDKDYRKDTVVKEEIYREHIEPYFTILFILDDRQQVVDMWRRIGLHCFQVAEGNF